MEENVILLVFMFLPAFCGAVMVLYFKRMAGWFQKIQGLRLVIGNVLVFAFLCSLLLPAGEIYYRFIYDATDSFGLTRVYQNWFTRHYHLNNYNMRDSINYVPKAIGKSRITFIGDSFTAGHGIENVEDRFVNKLRTMRPDLEIYAFAVNGWDTYGQMIHLSKLIHDGYETDQVVLVYVLNDIEDLMEEWGVIVDRIYSVQPGFLVKYSYLLNTLYFRYYSASDSDLSDYSGFVLDAYREPLWEKHCRRLRTIRDFLTDNRIEFRVVTFPFLQDLGPGYKYRTIHQQLDAFWKEVGIPHLDLLTVYEMFPAEELVVNRWDLHPNEKAHFIAAKEIDKFLREERGCVK